MNIDDEIYDAMATLALSIAQDCLKFQSVREPELNAAALQALALYWIAESMDDFVSDNKK